MNSHAPLSELAQWLFAKIPRNQECVGTATLFSSATFHHSSLRQLRQAEAISAVEQAWRELEAAGLVCSLVAVCARHDLVYPFGNEYVVAREGESAMELLARAEGMVDGVRAAELAQQRTSERARRQQMRTKYAELVIEEVEAEPQVMDLRDQALQATFAAIQAVERWAEADGAARISRAITSGWRPTADKFAQSPNEIYRSSRTAAMDDVQGTFLRLVDAWRRLGDQTPKAGAHGVIWAQWRRACVRFAERNDEVFSAGGEHAAGAQGNRAQLEARTSTEPARRDEKLRRVAEAEEAVVQLNKARGRIYRKAINARIDYALNGREI